MRHATVPRNALAIERMRREQAAMLRDVIDGLSRTPKELPCKYFYDAEGSRLFERICSLDAYYVTRTERAILDADVASIARFVGPRALVVEPGCGSGDKTRLLLACLEEPIAYVPVDISGEPLDRWVQSLREELPSLHVAPVHADFTSRFALPAVPRAHEAHPVLFFPGSTIGNFAPAEASAFLATMREALGAGARAVIGIDRVKDVATLERAYDDPEGVTAAFNLNLLRRLVRELGATIDVSRFRHVARYDREHACIEMHLESTVAQSIVVAGRTFAFRAGERIRTELSHKYSIESFAHIAAFAGFEVAEVWTDPRQWFSIVGLV